MVPPKCGRSMAGLRKNLPGAGRRIEWTKKGAPSAPLWETSIARRQKLTRAPKRMIRGFTISSTWSNESDDRS